MIELERRGPVRVLHLRAGENRVDRAWLAALEEALDAVEAEPGAPLVTVGEGRFYSTGLDLEALSGTSEREGWAVVVGLERVLSRLLAFPAPTVAALNGHAFAAGLMLALAHDVRLMRADRGWLCLPEVDLRSGRPLTPGMQALLAARLELPVLHELLATGARVGGESAVAKGLVHGTRAEEELLDAAVETATRLAGPDPAALATLKRSLYAGALEALEGLERGVRPADPSGGGAAAGSRGPAGAGGGSR